LQKISKTKNPPVNGGFFVILNIVIDIIDT